MKLVVKAVNSCAFLPLLLLLALISPTQQVCCSPAESGALRAHLTSQSEFAANATLHWPQPESQSQAQSQLQSLSHSVHLRTQNVSLEPILFNVPSNLELHIGAQFTLVSLSCLIALVIGATIFDYFRSIRAHSATPSPASIHIHDSNCGPSPTPEARDQRSDSISSVASSSLLGATSSAGSLASAHTPILPHTATPIDPKIPRVAQSAQQYVRNLEAAAQALANLRASNLAQSSEHDKKEPEKVEATVDYELNLTSQLLLSFSIRHSGRLIFQQTNESNSVNSLHGLRFLSMIWIIVVHSYTFALRWLLFVDSEQLKQIATSQLLANGNFACDTFLLIAGFLLGHLSTFERTSWRRFAFNLLHRYLRLAPLMMALIGLSAQLLRYAGNGPAWDRSTLMFDRWCRTNWWTNALFLQNFLHRQTMCLSHSWYSAVDFQLHLLGQLLILLFAHRRKLGLSTCLMLILASQLLTASLTWFFSLPALPSSAGQPEPKMDLYFGLLYIKPYSRAAPYLFGFLLAYLIRARPLARPSLIMSFTGWICSLVSLIALQLSLHPEPKSEIMAALYSALSRPVWACATGWILFACLSKRAGPIAWLLEAPFFVPFSRLTYPAFLVHPIVMAFFYGSRQSAFQFSHYLMLYLIIGNILLTYASAFLLSALFELPLLSMERIFRQSFHCRPLVSSKDKLRPIYSCSH